MRILHILDHSLPIQSGYSLRTRAMMVAQRAKGWHVQGLTSLRQGPVTASCACEDGLVFHRTPGRRQPWPLWGEICDLARLIASIVRVARAEDIDILHAHSPALNGLAGLIAAHLLRRPLVYEVRAFWEDAAVGNGTDGAGSWRGRMGRKLEDFVLRQADARVTICNGLAQDLVAQGLPASAISIVPNGVDMARMGAPRPRDAVLADALDLPSGADVIGYIGSFYPYEGVDDLIHAMPHLVALRPTCHLVLIGSGPAEKALRDLAAQSPMASHIRFVGAVPHAAVEAYYGCINILVYPRKKMRLTDLVTPLKPLEAMAQRCLVAASAVGGHQELIVDGQTGTLFAPDNPPEMAQALAVLLADTAGQDARRDAAYAFVAQERNWASLVDRYEAVYHRACRGRPSDRVFGRSA